jgi:CheY-like chemotaxis protein/anti-anti-sigma regulatory factor
MSMHFISHRWEVTTVEDGTMVTFGQQDLDAPTLSVLIDDLFELVQESGQTNLYLNFAKVHLVPSIAFSKLICLGDKLNEAGCRLILCNVDHHLYECLEAGRLTDNLDIWEAESPPSHGRHPEVAIRVLLADPDERLLVSNRVFLSRNGFEVATATNGLECLEKLRDFRPDVLVLEPEMSWGQGDDVLALMEQEADVPRVPVLILSGGYDTSRFPEPAYSIHEHQAKPLPPELLANRIRWLFESSPPPGGFFA